MTWFNENLSRVAYAKIPSALFSSRFYKHHDSFVIYTILDQEGLSELLAAVVEKLEELGLTPDSPPSEEYIQPEQNITHSFHGDLANIFVILLTW